MTALIRAELLKLRTTKMWWGLLIGALVVTAIGTLATALTAGSDPGAGPPIPGLDDPATVRSVYGQGLGAYIFALVLGIIGMSGEYRHQTITAAFLVTPRRTPVVVAKLVAYAFAGLIYGLAATVLAVGLGASIIAAKGYELRLTSDDVPRSVALAVLAVAVWAVYGLGLGTLLKNQVVAILVALGFTIAVEPLLTFLVNQIDLGALVKFFPGNASSAIVQGIDADVELLPWWGGALMLLGYGLLFSGLGALITLRRDIT
jgi:ABC-2 type transport system permease protein